MNNLNYQVLTFNVLTLLSMSKVVLKWLKLKGEVCPCKGGRCSHALHYTAEWKPMDKHRVYVLWKTRNFECTTQIHNPILVSRMLTWKFFRFTEWNLDIFQFILQNQDFFWFGEWKLEFVRFTEWDPDIFPVYGIKP